MRLGTFCHVGVPCQNPEVDLPRDLHSSATGLPTRVSPLPPADSLLPQLKIAHVFGVSSQMKGMKFQAAKSPYQEAKDRHFSCSSKVALSQHDNA